MTLVIMAAGFGSRYKGGIKQLDGIGPSGEILMDYAIYDAYKVGFRKLVLIIREELEEFVEQHFVGKLPQDLELKLVYQHTTDLPENYNYPNRVKPWGTGQAILLCRDVVDGPFAVINADDFYGREAFQEMYNYLKENNEFCMPGYILKNTLSEHGGVNRGICKIDNNSNLLEIDEIFKIEKKDNIVSGKDINGETVLLNETDYCSLNFWGFTPIIFDILEERFKMFLDTLVDEEKDEFLLSMIVNKIIKENNIKLKSIPTDSEWFGMSYIEDKEMVKEKIKEYIEKSIYPSNLWNN